MAGPWTGGSVATGVVTPEAVALEFEPAGVGSRLLALLLDLVIQGAALFAVLVVAGLGGVGGLPESVAVIVLVVAVFLILFGYPITSETLWRGRTVGKAAAGLRVRTREGAPVRFRHAAIRGALSLVDFYVTSGVAATLSVLLTRDNQRLGDLAAGTLVVRERNAAAVGASAVSFAPPPGWEPYAASLDVSAVTPEQYGLVRSFLLRSHGLSPEAQAHLSLRLADPLARVCRHEVPPGVWPVTFLVCVAAAYQQRHGALAVP